MAKKVYKRTLTTTDKVQISGILSEDNTIELDGECVDLIEKLEPFVGKHIELSIVEKTEEEVIDDTTSDDEE